MICLRLREALTQTCARDTGLALTRRDSDARIPGVAAIRVFGIESRDEAFR